MPNKLPWLGYQMAIHVLCHSNVARSKLPLIHHMHGTTICISAAAIDTGVPASRQLMLLITAPMLLVAEPACARTKTPNLLQQGHRSLRQVPGRSARCAWRGIRDRPNMVRALIPSLKPVSSHNTFSSSFFFLPHQQHNFIFEPHNLPHLQHIVNTSINARTNT